MKTENAIAVEPRLVGIQAASVYLGATVWAVRSLAWCHAVPHLKIGNRILFDKTDLDKFIEAKKRAVA